MNYYNYFTEIEEHFVRRRGKHLYVSPLDWSLIAAWKDAGVPLHVALRGIDIAMDSFDNRKRTSASRVGTLYYCHGSVMEEHARWLESRLGESAETPAGLQPADAPPSGSDTKSGPDASEVASFLKSRISEIITLAGKQLSRQSVLENVERVRERLSSIESDLPAGKTPPLDSLERDLGILDEILVTALREEVPPERVEEWESEAKKELKVYRKRLPRETYQKILENHMKTRVRQLFGIGELSLFHL
jgi:hypothetical protein